MSQSGPPHQGYPPQPPPGTPSGQAGPAATPGGTPGAWGPAAGASAYGGGPPGYSPSGPPPPDLIARRIRGPAIALLISNLLGLIFSVVGLIIPNPMGMHENYSEYFQDSELPPESQEQVLEFVTSFQEFSSFITIPPLVIGILLIWGCVQMMNAQRYGFAVATAIVSMIPCLGPCCILGIPFGIWALVALSDIHVKELFRQKAAQGLSR